MGVFNLFSKDFKCTHNDEYPRYEKNTSHIKLVEPSVGRIVELQITEEDVRFEKIYRNSLNTYVKCLMRYGVQSEVTDKGVRLTFPNDDIAEDTRKIWRK